MPDEKLMQKLTDYVEDAHAMEESVLRMLDSLIATTSDEKIRRDIERHRKQTEEQEQRLRKRLDALGRRPSARKGAQALVGTLAKGVGDQVRADKPGKNARDGFVTEHMEIAAYELLERLALVAGDAKTALVARQNKREEEAMARKIASNWDRFLALTLVDEGIEVPKPQRRSGRSGSPKRSGRRRGRSRDGGDTSRDALYEQAKKLRIKGRSRMTKAELARAVSKRR